MVTGLKLRGVKVNGFGVKGVGGLDPLRFRGRRCKLRVGRLMLKKLELWVGGYRGLGRGCGLELAVRCAGLGANPRLGWLEVSGLLLRV